MPDGVVLTAHALAGGVAEPSPAAQDALREALERLGGPLAVRSSAVAEDLAGASYAGQYETVLGVDDVEGLVAAVRHCRASAAAERVAAYERDRPRGDEEHGGEAHMAVLMQRLVPADAAGVAFTANPVNGDHSETLVSAVRGLGDRLVSGQATPEEWTVRDDAVERRGAAEGAIDAGQARAVAALARRVEAHFGAPQDIEWAIAGGELYLLQARPITAIPSRAGAADRVEPVPVPVEAPPGFWEREASHAPLPWSPMNRSLLIARRNTAFRDTFARFGVLADGLEFREIGGWEYSRLVPPGGQDRPAPPAPVMWLLTRLHPDLRRRARVAKEALRTDLAGRTIRRWHEEVRPDLEARIRALRAADLGALSDEALLEHWARIESLLDLGLATHFELHAPIAFARKELVDTCRALLGWDEPRAFELVAGLSEASTAPAARLAELARMARERPAVLALIECADRDAASRLREVDPEFAGAFDAYQGEFAVRGLRYEVAEATLEESPEITLATLRDQVRQGYDPAAHAGALAARRKALIAEARAALGTRSEAGRARFERVLARAEQAHPVHEENEFYTTSVPVALARYALLEVGRQLAERGLIAERDTCSSSRPPS